MNDSRHKLIYKGLNLSIILLEIPGTSLSVTMRLDWSSPVRSLIRTHTSTSSGPASLAEYVVSLNTRVTPEMNNHEIVSTRTIYRSNFVEFVCNNQKLGIFNSR